MSSAPASRGVVLHRLCPSCDIEVRAEVTHCPTCNSKLVEIREEVDNLVGSVIDGRFEIRAKLGQGGMGTVYRAWQKSVGREVAVKLIERSFSRDAMAVRRFLREARLASQLSHPNTVSVFDFGQIDDGRLFIAMELIRGRTLHQLVREEGAFSIERVVRVGVQICDALEAAHALGIVHRDLKLENLIVLDHPPGRDLLKVLDFGLAKNVHEPGSHATQSGIVVGTPRYMSPEAATTGVTGPPADVYSLGVILGELATGMPMWSGDSLPELVQQKYDPANAIARAPGALRAVLEQLLDPEPERRPTAAQTRTLLTHAASQAVDPDAGETLTDSDPHATKNIRTPSPMPEVTQPLTPRRLAAAPTETPAPGVAARMPAPARTTPTPSRPARPVSAPADDIVRPSQAMIRPSGSLDHDLDASRRRRWPFVIVGVVAAGLVAAAVVLATGTGGEAPRRAATAPADAAVASQVAVDAQAPVASGATSASATGASASTPTREPELVTITIDSSPPHAMIEVAGKRQTAPVTIQVPRSSAPLAITATRAGNQSQKLSVVPDENKPVLVKLKPARGPKRGGDEVVPF